MKKCNDCLAHYSDNYNHICPPWLKALKRYHDKKQDQYSCKKCDKPYIPDRKSVIFGTKKWDGHIYKFNCDCVDSSIRISIG